MKTTSVSNVPRYIKDVFSETKLVIFIVVLVGALIVAIITLGDILKMPSGSNASTSTSSKIDSTIVSRLNKLSPSNDNTLVKTLPAGRINPFSE